MKKLLFISVFLWCAVAARAVEPDIAKHRVGIRITNLSAPAVFSLSSTRNWWPDDAGGFWPFLGYLGKDGLTKEMPAREKRLSIGEHSGWVTLPSFGSILHIRRQGEKPWACKVELMIEGDGEQEAVRTIRWENDIDTLHICLYHRPVSSKPEEVCLLTFEELLAENEQAARETRQNSPWKKAPARIAVYSDITVRPTDDPALIGRQLDLLRVMGFNGISCPEPALLPQIDRKGFAYLRAGGAGFDQFSVEQSAEMKGRFTSAAAAALAPHERYGVRDKVRNLSLGDEISNGRLSDYLAAGEAARASLVEYLTKLNVPPADFGWTDYDALKLPSANVMKAENPPLYYWANRARMEQIGDWWKLADSTNARCFPKAWGSPNWAVVQLLNGGYDTHAYDLWLLYRKKALRGNWGEDWYGGLNGFTAYQSDMMRSQSPGLPLGMYDISQGDYSTLTAHFKLYEELARGVSEICWYSYGGLYGTEWLPWGYQRDMAREITQMNLEMGEAEPYLLDTQPEPAKVAVLWTPAQEIWDPSLHQNLPALYYLLLHANYAFDIISSYDVDDGALARYRVLYLPFDYVEQGTWAKIQGWTEQGGSLVLEGVPLRDEYHRPLPLDPWLPGCGSALVSQVKSPAVAGPATYPTIEETKPAAFPVVWSKSSLTPPEEAQTLLSYADGQPAAFSVAKEKGQVTIYGFHPALSYLRDQLTRDNATSVNMVFHQFSPELRTAVTAPIVQAGIEPVAGITDDLVVARRRLGNGKECVVLFDYHFGNLPAQPFAPYWENVGERRVMVQLHYPAAKARSLRGKILQRNGQTVEVAFRGMDMILVDE